MHIFEKIEKSSKKRKVGNYADYNEFVVAGLYRKAQRYGVPGARPAGLRGHPGPRTTRSRPRNDFRNKPLTGYRNKYISQNFMIRGIFTERKEIV